MVCSPVFGWMPEHPLDPRSGPSLTSTAALPRRAQGSLDPTTAAETATAGAGAPGAVVQGAAATCDAGAAVAAASGNVDAVAAAVGSTDPAAAAASGGADPAIVAAAIAPTVAAGAAGATGVAGAAGATGATGAAGAAGAAGATGAAGAAGVDGPMGPGGAAAAVGDAATTAAGPGGGAGAEAGGVGAAAGGLAQAGGDAQLHALEAPPLPAHRRSCSLGSELRRLCVCVCDKVRDTKVVSDRSRTRGVVKRVVTEGFVNRTDATQRTATPPGPMFGFPATTCETLSYFRFRLQSGFVENAARWSDLDETRLSRLEGHRDFRHETSALQQDVTNVGQQFTR